MLSFFGAGNSRIKRLTCNLDFVGHISNEGLEGRSVTGVCMGSSDDSLLVINWRSKTVTEISLEGHTIGSFTHDDLKEPIVSFNHSQAQSRLFKVRRAPAPSRTKK